MASLILFRMIAVFPDFTKLTLAHRDEYNELMRKYPPFSDITFPTLHIWWNQQEQLSVSALNDNLVIDYRLHFDEKNSGYSLVGKHLIDSSIRTIFDYLKLKGEPVRLVHVPEFVVGEIGDRTGLKIEEEHDYHEYVMDAKALASLESSDLGRIRRKVRRFLREVENEKVEVKPLNMAPSETKALVFNAVQSWQKVHPKRNDPDDTEAKAIAKAIHHQSDLGIENLCLFINDKLQAIVLYHLSLDKQYYIIHHFQVDYSTPFIFDYMTSQIAKKAVEESVPYLNMEMDLGIEGLRAHKMGLRPVTFLKKFTLKLAK